MDEGKIGHHHAKCLGPIHAAENLSANSFELISDLESQRKNGSWRESGKVHVLRGFLKSDEFGSRGGQALGFQQQVVEVAIAASAA